VNEINDASCGSTRTDGARAISSLLLFEAFFREAFSD
jgi:hypothetical protein